MSFPDGFLWGVAAASYQIEGASREDGRQPSVWDAFAERPGAVFDGHTGETACDHYHRYAEDVALIADLGARAYRLSISWPRVLPDGETINEKGLDFYDRVVDTMLSRGIAPWVTLFHWDFPLALFHRGGWLNRESAAWFERFTEAVAARIGDRVTHWLTINEPQVFLGLGHAAGRHAPGMRYDRPDLLRAIHHCLLAHGRSVQIIRAVAEKKPVIGWAAHGCLGFPASSSEQNVAAARALTMTVEDAPEWYFNNTWYSDPAILGHYPEDGLNLFGADMPKDFERDLETIHQSMDFCGVNIYQGSPTEADGHGGYRRVGRRPGYPHTMHHWPIDPEIMYWGTRFLYERYKLPIYITENGCAAMDWVHADGKVHDAPRIDYLLRHLCALRDAIADGVDVRGYFQWSILDNYEWAEGYRMRFGLIYVDFETMERTLKDSYAWYQQVIMSNGACLPEKLAPLR
jgi:beta-glucosidase